MTIMAILLTSKSPFSVHVKPSLMPIHSKLLPIAMAKIVEKLDGSLA